MHMKVKRSHTVDFKDTYGRAYSVTCEVGSNDVLLETTESIPEGTIYKKVKLPLEDMLEALSKLFELTKV